LSADVARVTVRTPSEFQPAVRKEAEEIKRILHVRSITYEISDDITVEIG